MIELTKYEVQWVLLCKGQLEYKFPFKGNWCETLKPLFKETYGWDPDEDNNYNDYLRGMFAKLLDIHSKIKDNWSDPNAQLKEVFYASFHKGIGYDEELPIERAIHCLCGLIQCTSVTNKVGQERFDLKSDKVNDPLKILLNRLDRIGINLKLSCNVPWIYIDSINGKRVTEKFHAEHGFTIAFLPIRFNETLTMKNMTDITEIFKLIRKYTNKK